MTTSRLQMPSVSRRSFLQYAGLAGGVTLLGSTVACAGPTGKPSQDTLVLGLNRSLVSLDNKLNQFDAAVTAQRGVRQGLTRIGDDLHPQLVLADRFDATSPTEWTVRLREGVKYSDGTPVSIEDVDVAMQMYQQVSGSFVAPQFPEWPTVIPIDDRTFILRTTSPLPVLDSLMSNILITPAAANEPNELQTGIGTGPFVVTESNRGTGEYSLAANQYYWGEEPSVQQVRVRFIPEEAARVVALRSGEVDVIDSISPDSAEQLASLPGVQIETVPSTRINQLFFNFRKPAGHPLANPRVREALSYAVDGESLARDVLIGSAVPATGAAPSTLSGAVETGKYTFDPVKARQMLDAEGVTDLELTFIWETGEFTNDVSLMESVTQMMNDIGVRVKLQQFEPGGDISSWRQGKVGDWDVLGNGYGNQTGLALTTIQGMYAGTAEKEATRDTYHGYVFPEITQKIELASSEPDPVRRATLLADAQQDIWNTWPCLWSFVPNALLAKRTRVQNVALTPINSYDLGSVRLEA
ncbi:ABC transporter substrate-binding protein [Rhodococcoides yunnanense]|uniref:ABC transporter substrate-binding protein n=1 Tax=Rhodococcoides yunnanense TaxID=278209 RepID=UPI000932D166|nr:ABC transporter substrate-binding protein [Rhodococcus yunnanensis]